MNESRHRIGKPFAKRICSDKNEIVGPLDSKMMSRALSLVLTVLLYAGCTTDIVPATGEKRFLGYTWQQETAIGKQSSKEIAALFGLYRDPQLERYVDGGR